MELRRCPPPRAPNSAIITIFCAKFQRKQFFTIALFEAINFCYDALIELVLPLCGENIKYFVTSGSNGDHLFAEPHQGREELIALARRAILLLSENFTNKVEILALPSEASAK